jgi:hypothetical protein
VGNPPTLGFAPGYRSNIHAELWQHWVRHQQFGNVLAGGDIRDTARQSDNSSSRMQFELCCVPTTSSALNNIRTPNVGEVTTHRYLPQQIHVGLQGCEMLGIPHCLDNWLTDGSEVVGMMHWQCCTPQKHFLFLFLVPFLLGAE